jgi:hypothetical protein
MRSGAVRLDFGRLGLYLARLRSAGIDRCHENSQQPEISQGPRQELPRGPPAWAGLRDQQEKSPDEVPAGLAHQQPAGNACGALIL